MHQPAQLPLKKLAEALISILRFKGQTPIYRVLQLEGAKIPFTLPTAKTKTMVLVFGFNFPFSAGFQGKSGRSFGKKWF